VAERKCCCGELAANPGCCWKLDEYAGCCTVTDAKEDAGWPLNATWCGGGELYSPPPDAYCARSWS
jgi:hypothetical protein